MLIVKFYYVRKQRLSIKGNRIQKDVRPTYIQNRP